MSRPVDDTAARLITLMEFYAEYSGLSVSTVCRHAAGSGDVVARLLRGSTITIRRFDRAVRYLSAHWPAELVWPASVPRPASRGTPPLDALVVDPPRTSPGAPRRAAFHSL